MKQEAEFFGEEVELSLVYIAKRLSEAITVEEVLNGAGIDFLVEPDRYSGGLIFRSERVGAFFYVVPEKEEAARGVLIGRGYKPYSAV